MKTIRSVRLFYIIYTLYTLFVMSVSNYQVKHAAAGLGAIWIVFFFFHLGYKANRRIRTENQAHEAADIQYPLSKVVQWRPRQYVIAAAASWACSIIAARFYTGNGFMTVIRSITGGGNSIYNAYQKYFAEGNLGAFSISKIPYILMMAFLVIILIVSYVGILLCNKHKPSIIQICYLGMITLSYLYFGMARGTNFETYIVFVIISFCLLKKANSVSMKKRGKLLIIFLAACVAMVLVYRFVVMARGVVFSNGICPEIQYDPSRVISLAFPTLVTMGLSFFGYLGYGIYTIGVVLTEVGCSTLERFGALILPKGFSITDGTSLNSVLSQTIDIGVKWSPDFNGLTDLLGIPLFIGLVILLGYFLCSVTNSDTPELLKEVIQVVIFIEMLSIPVGNFIVASSSNELLVVYVLIWYVSARYLRVKVKV